MNTESDQPSIFIHPTLMGMYSPHIFVTDWMVGQWQISKKAFVWMMFMTTDVMIGVILGIIYADFCGFVLFIMMNVGMMAMMYVGTPYNGIVKKMGFPHLVLGIAVLYIILRLSVDLGCDSSFFCPQITYNNKRGLFIYLLASIAVFSVVLVLDCMDIYLWYIKGDHAVWRSKKTVDKLIALGALEGDTPQNQVIQQNHNRAESIDQFGYKAGFKSAV